MRSAFIAIALTAAVWSAVFALQTTPAAPVQAASGYAPRNARERFAVDLLARLGNTAPTLDTIAFVVSWTLAEDSGDGALTRNNPLNTTMCGYNMVGAINGDGACGVQTYATYQDGLDATVATLAGHDYNALVYALQTNDATGALQALIASPWAESRYNGGVEWPHVELTVASPASAPASADPRRQQVIELALSQLGKPYNRGSEGPDAFDCSGLVQWSYQQLGIDTTRTTFTQLKSLPVVEPVQVQIADMVYFQYPRDQHVGLLADLDGDGRWDMIQSGGQRYDVNIVYDVFANPVYTNAIIGYRRAL